MRIRIISGHQPIICRRPLTGDGMILKVGRILSGRMFIHPIPREWATSRFWLFYAEVAPNFKEWPDRYTTDPFKGDDQYTQFVEPLSLYPFQCKA